MKTYPVLWFVIAILACAALSVITPASQPVHAAGPWYVAPGGSDTNTCTAPSAPCATINGALNKPGFVAGDTILVATGVYTGTGDRVVWLDKSVTLSGGWDAGFTAQNGVSTIDGEGARQGIAVSVFATATVERFVIQNCTGSASGGAVGNGGTLTLNNCIIRNSAAYATGINTDNATLTLNNCTVSDNSGTGIKALGSTLTVANSIIRDNRFRGIDIQRGHVTVNNSAISGNAGGGIYNYGVLTLNNSTISGNGSAASEGGGIYAPFDSGTSTTLNNSSVSGNMAAQYGGGIYRESDVRMTLRNTILAGNKASGGPDCFGFL